MRVAVLVAAAVLCAGCGSSGGRVTAAGTDPDRATGPVADDLATTVCSPRAASHAARPPAGFPTDFPLPPGTVVTAGDDRGSAGLVVTGITGRPFAEVLAALQHDLPARGYTPDHGETEPRDAESDWTSAGFTGRWAIREVPSCPGDTTVSVVARPR